MTDQQFEKKSSYLYHKFGNSHFAAIHEYYPHEYYRFYLKTVFERVIHKIFYVNVPSYKIFMQLKSNFVDMFGFFSYWDWHFILTVHAVDDQQSKFL